MILDDEYFTNLKKELLAKQNNEVDEDPVVESAPWCGTGRINPRLAKHKFPRDDDSIYGEDSTSKMQKKGKIEVVDKTKRGNHTLTQAAPINMAEAFGGTVSKPSLAQYGLDKVDIEALCAAHERHLHPPKVAQSQPHFGEKIFAVIPSLGLIAFFGGAILGVISIFNSTLGAYFGKDGPYTTPLIIITIAGFCAPTISDWLENLFYRSPKAVPFPQQKEWDSYQKYIAHQKRYTDYLHTLDLNYWRNMDGYKFEREVTKLYSSLGYSTRHTGSSGDNGVDIELMKDGKRFAVQCKAHNQKIAPKVARELYGVMNAGSYDGAILVTTNGASQNTVNWCNNLPGRPITILDASDLVKMSKSLSSDVRSVVPKEQSITTAEKGIKHVWLELSDEDVPF